MDRIIAISLAAYLNLEKKLAVINKLFKSNTNCGSSSVIKDLWEGKEIEMDVQITSVFSLNLV